MVTLNYNHKCNEIVILASLKLNKFSETIFSHFTWGWCFRTCLGFFCKIKHIFFHIFPINFFVIWIVTKVKLNFFVIQLFFLFQFRFQFFEIRKEKPNKQFYDDKTQKKFFFAFTSSTLGNPWRVIRNDF